MNKKLTQLNQNGFVSSHLSNSDKLCFPKIVILGNSLAFKKNAAFLQNHNDCYKRSTKLFYFRSNCPSENDSKISTLTTQLPS